jgi:hypothetical protein
MNIGNPSFPTTGYAEPEPFCDRKNETRELLSAVETAGTSCFSSCGVWGTGSLLGKWLVETTRFSGRTLRRRHLRRVLPSAFPFSG